MDSQNIEKETKIPTTNKLFVGAKLYRTNYNEITDVITIERVTKTQAIAKGGTYKFSIEVSSFGTASKIGNTDRWSSASFYLETEKLKKQLWKQKTVKRLKDTDFSKLEDEVLEKLISLIPTTNTIIDF